MTKAALYDFEHAAYDHTETGVWPSALLASLLTATVLFFGFMSLL